MSNTELNKEILDILDNVIYWETCPKDYKVRIKAIKKQLTLTDVSERKSPHWVKKLLMFANTL